MVERKTLAGRGNLSHSGSGSPWIGFDLVHERSHKEFKDYAKSKAIDLLTRSENPIVLGTSPIGSGQNGVVFPHNGPEGGVVKFDRGGAEANLANFLTTTKAGKKLAQLVPTLPKIFKPAEHIGNYVDSVSGETAPVHAIHREDLKDFISEKQLNDYWGYTNKPRNQLSPETRKLGAAANQLLILNDLMRDHGSGSLKNLHNEIDKWNNESKKVTDPSFHDNVDRISKDYKTLSRAGIVPCDLHPLNWGVRSDNSLVIRDSGCFTATSNKSDLERTPLRYRPQTGGPVIAQVVTSKFDTLAPRKKDKPLAPKDDYNTFAPRKK